MSRLDWTDILISEVKSRSILWDTTHKNYHNRHAVDEEWATVGKLGEVSGTDAKLKWKSLRDSFRRELKKVPRCGKNEKKSWRSKWAYFESMLFLKDVMQSRETHGNVMKKTDDSLDYTEENDECDFIGDRTIEPDATDNDANENQTKGEEDFIQDTELTNVCTIRHAHLPLETNFAFTTSPFKRSRKEVDPSKNSARATAKRKKRIEKSDVFGSRMADADNKKMDPYPDNNNDDDDDDDWNFFKSLLPYIRQLPPLKKLRIRAQYQTILINAIQELEYKKNAAASEYSAATASSSVVPVPSSSPSTFSNYQQERAFQTTPDPLLQPAFLNCQALCKSEY